MSNVEPKSPATVKDLIDAFGGSAAFSVVIHRNPSTASEMKRRGSIPVQYWPGLVAAASERSIIVNYETLVAMHLPQECAA